MLGYVLCMCNSLDECRCVSAGVSGSWAGKEKDGGSSSAWNIPIERFLGDAYLIPWILLGRPGALWMVVDRMDGSRPEQQYPD